MKLDATKPQFGKSSFRLKKVSCNNLIQMLFVLAHQIILAQCCMTS